MATNAVKFVSCTFSTYQGLAEHSAHTLYFITDTHRIYKGDVPFTGGLYETCIDYPATGNINTIYVNTKDGSAKYWDGKAYVTIVKPAPASITGTGSADEQATTKAVVDYVASEISKLNASELNSRLAAVETKAKANETAIGIINGTGAGSISKALEDAKAYTDTAKNTLQGEIDKKATKATTLAGYGIADAYTKTEADSAIATAVAGAHHLKRQIVTALPPIGEANEDTIYMVLKTTGVAGNESGNVYNEYMLINGKFEQIGDSKVDLTDYATKAYADDKANKALDDAKADSLKKIQALDKADTAVADNYVSAVSQTDGIITVTRAKLPVTSVAEGTANGTIAVNGTDVKVHGLGSAAYANTGAFDAAGAAAAAQTAAANDATEKANAAKEAAISTASADATQKANEALASAKAYATTKANAAQAAAEKTAAADATTKAEAAKNAAIEAASTDATTKAEAAKQAAITTAAADAKSKADTAEANAKKYADDLISWEELG